MVFDTAPGSVVKQSSIVMLLVAVILVCGCGGQERDEKPAVTSSTTHSVQETSPDMFDVKVSSLTCTWAVKARGNGVNADCVRVVASGSARGPVGSRLELPILSWSDDNFDCGSWTEMDGALIAVGHSCIRGLGRPETTRWQVDTGGDDCPLKDYFNKNIGYAVKLYRGGEINPVKVDETAAACLD